ncbi:MAG: glycosyltransferase family 2 protein [Capnocytophaga sp.]|nr:glycosyltransferase family 2 protein [Capnocytophaga sp.]
MKISVVINTYNAEKFLQKTLESVKEFDEIVICDMHSTDSTIAIVQRYNATIVYHENTGFVEPARNFAIQSATHDWVLLLDADETATEGLKNELRKQLQNIDFEALKIPRKNYFMGRFMRAEFPDLGIRFFRKDKIDWPKDIHSTPKIDGRIKKLAKDPKLAIEHLADDSLSDILKKMERYTEAELLRRKSKNYGYGKLILSPFFRFFKCYFVKQGFRDGKEGFIFAMTKAHYKFYTLAKLIESSRKQ